jgi:flagellar motor switch protein FliM
MEPDVQQADFQNTVRLEGVNGERLRMAQETLAKDLSINLSAFLRNSIAVTFSNAGETIFRDFLAEHPNCCVSVALVRPESHKLLVVIENSVLFPLVGIAVGAKPGSFTPLDRQPTDIELQVVNLLVRLILGETYRAWATVLETQLETVTTAVDRTPARVFPPAESVFSVRFDVTLGEHSGKLVLLTPAVLFRRVLSEAPPARETRPEPPGSLASVLELMLPAKVAVDVWLDGCEMRLGDLLQLREGQIVKLDHPVERKVVCTLNGSTGYSGQIVSTGSRRAFLAEEFTPQER